MSEIDYSEYFRENLDFTNLGACGVNLELNDYENVKLRFLKKKLNSEC